MVVEGFLLLEDVLRTLFNVILGTKDTRHTPHLTFPWKNLTRRNTPLLDNFSAPSGIYLNFISYNSQTFLADIN